MFRRETLIALRARRLGYRIAVDFLFPRLLVQEPPPLAHDAPPDEETEEAKRERLAEQNARALLSLIALVLGVLTVCSLLVLFFKPS